MVSPSPATSLINRLLDRDYESVARPVLNAIARSMNSGIVQRRLRELNEEAARLAEQGQKLTPDNPILRALLADVDDVLRADRVLIDGAAEPLQMDAIRSAGQIQRQLALPGFADATLRQLGVRWNSPDPEAIARVVRYAQSDPWENLLGTYGGDVIDVIRNQAIRGVALGWSPLRTAREITNVTQRLPGYMANNIMRTLQLTSYRDATAVHQTANQDITEQVVRIAALDRRTCLSCVAQHGDVIWDKERDAGTPVPRVNDHHMGRCTSIIIVTGIPRTVQTGEEWWASLSDARKAEQVSVARSPGKLEALLGGRAGLRDFIHKYNDPVFGEMVREGSLKGLSPINE